MLAIRTIIFPDATYCMDGHDTGAWIVRKQGTEFGKETLLLIKHGEAEACMQSKSRPFHNQGGPTPTNEEGCATRTNISHRAPATFRQQNEHGVRQAIGHVGTPQRDAFANEAFCS